MKRGGLFFIGLISAIITIISLNAAFGRTGFYNERYTHYGRFHRCGDYDNRNNDQENKKGNLQHKDSTNSSY